MAQGRPLMKTCQRCGQEKRLDDFYHNRTKPDFHNGICKACQGEVDKENQAKGATE